MTHPDPNTLDLSSLRSRRSQVDAESVTETLPIPRLRPQTQPSPATETANHPEAAAMARERIAAAASHHPIIHPDTLPASPTGQLITDKPTLATRADLAPTTIRRKLPSAVAPLITAVGIFAVVLLLFKAPIVFSQIRYSLGETSASPIAADVTNGNSSIVPAESTITIPKINVHAPVEYIDSVQEADVQRALQDGVVHYGTTANPGQPGNVAIFGHSSNDWWEPGNFKFVFVLLDKLVTGDQITMDFQSVRYTYEVTGSTVVEPTAVEVLNPTATPTLTLITCSPPGTSLKRLVVTAKQISPAPKNGVVVTPSDPSDANQTTLPSSAPSFFEQFNNFWEGVWQGITSLTGRS